jgi:hypothetical protein
MAQKTDGQLTTEANIIRDETAIGANTALRIGTMFDGLIDSKINNDRVSNDTALGNDATLVPSQNAVKTYVDAFATGLLTDNGNYDPTITSQYPTSGNTLSGGAVQKGDLWYINADGTINGNSVLIGYSVRALVDNAGATTDANWSISNLGIGFVPENVANKSTDVNLGTSDIYYPSQNAVKSYVDTQVAAVLPYTPENVANKSQDIAANPSSTVLYPSNKAVADYVNSGGSPYKVYTTLLTQSGGSIIYTAGNFDGGPSKDNDGFNIGVTYEITANPNNTDLSLYGAPNNSVGTKFVSIYSGNLSDDNLDVDVIFTYDTGAPVVTVLENTIGNIWFTYSSSGIYMVNSSALFTASKTWTNPTIKDNINLPLSMFRNTDSLLYLIDANGDNGLLETSIEIRVYP